MARLHIEEIAGHQVCLVTDVILPNHERKHYSAIGPDGLSEIIRRIKADAAGAKEAKPCLSR